MISSKLFEEFENHLAHKHNDECTRQCEWCPNVMCIDTEQTHSISGGMDQFWVCEQCFQKYKTV